MLICRRKVRITQLINELEQKLEELFISQGIGSWVNREDSLDGAKQAVERWKSTTKYITSTEEGYIEAVKLRLKQGGVTL